MALSDPTSLRLPPPVESLAVLKGMNATDGPKGPKGPREPSVVSVVQRLQAELVREGFDPHWRQHPGNTKGGWLLPLPSLDVGPRFRDICTGDKGLPAQGLWETLCGWHINAAQHCPQERHAYAGRNDPGVDLWDAQEQAAWRTRSIQQAIERTRQAIEESRHARQARSGRGKKLKDGATAEIQ